MCLHWIAMSSDNDQREFSLSLQYNSTLTTSCYGHVICWRECCTTKRRKIVNTQWRENVTLFLAESNSTDLVASLLSVRRALNTASPSRDDSDVIALLVSNFNFFLQNEKKTKKSKIRIHFNNKCSQKVLTVFDGSVFYLQDPSIAEDAESWTDGASRLSDDVSVLLTVLSSSGGRVVVLSVDSVVLLSNDSLPAKEWKTLTNTSETNVVFS